MNAKIPNDETIGAMEELQDPKYRSATLKFKTVEDLFDDLNEISPLSALWAPLPHEEWGRGKKEQDKFSG